MDRYETEPDYLLPNDANEANRLRMYHFVAKYTWEGINYKSPLEEDFKRGGLRVLDVGCGSGGWLLDMSLEYPNSTFIGIDISMMFDEDIRPNLGFIQCNALQGLPFFDNTFDLVHQGNMLTAWKETEWPIIIKDMLRCVKKNGWIELFEAGYDLKNVGPKLKVILDATTKRYSSKGIKIDMKPNLKRLLEATGELGSEVHISEAIVPFWGNNVGVFAFKLFRKAQTSMGMHKYMGITESAFDKMLDAVAQEAEEYRTCIRTHRYYAQKK